MKRRSFLGGLLTATLTTGLFLVGSMPASAQYTAKVLPPVLSNIRITCHDEGAGVSAKLSNPNATQQDYMVAIHASDVHYDYVAQPPAHGFEIIGFGDLPDRTYSLRVQNAVGDFVAQSDVRVKCRATPPTGTPSATPTRTPTATPTGTPSATPTGTPTASPTRTPTTGPSSTPTAVPTTPVAVPTAVDAGLAGPTAPDDNHGRTIVGAGLLAAVGIIIGLGSLLVRRRRGLQQL
jgi:hypothetical protein